VRVLRVSHYQSPYVPGQNPNDPNAPANQPMSVVARDIDLTVTPEEALNEQTCFDAEHKFFAVGEIFDVPANTTIQHATILAERRRQRRVKREVNQSMLFYWDAMYLRRVHTNGVISGSGPIPLTASEIEEVLKLLAMHPDYDHHRIVAFSSNGVRVSMQDGKIT
jgi:hypothetical protein